VGVCVQREFLSGGAKLFKNKCHFPPPSTTTTKTLFFLALGYKYRNETNDKKPIYIKHIELIN